MEITSPVGSGTVLPATEPCKQKTGKSSGIKVRRTADGSVAVRVPPGAPAFLPPAGQEITFHMEPEAVRAAALPASDPAALVPFVVELVRPARPDGKSGVEWHCTFEPDKSSRDVVLAWLTPGEPYAVSLNGRPLLSHDDHGWNGHRRCTLAIHASASREMLAMLGVVSAVNDSAHKPFLAVIIAPGSLTEVRLDSVLSTWRGGNTTEKGGCK